LPIVTSGSRVVVISVHSYKKHWRQQYQKFFCCRLYQALKYHLCLFIYCSIAVVELFYRYAQAPKNIDTHNTLLRGCSVADSQADLVSVA
jgi:hypothetical protein